MNASRGFDSISPNGRVASLSTNRVRVGKDALALWPRIRRAGVRCLLAAVLLDPATCVASSSQGIVTASCLTSSKVRVESATFSPASDGSLIAIQSGLTFGYLRKRLQRSSVSLKAGVDTMLASPDLVASRMKMFRLYAGLHWDGLWSEAQLDAFTKALGSRSAIAVQAQRAYTTPLQGTEHGIQSCSVAINDGNGAETVDFVPRSLPFALPLRLSIAGLERNTYDPALAKQLSLFFPKKGPTADILSGRWLWKWIALWAGNLLPEALQKPVLTPSTAVQSLSASPDIKPTYVRYWFDDNYDTWWSVALAFARSPNLAIVIQVPILHGKPAAMSNRQFEEVQTELARLGSSMKAVPLDPNGSVKAYDIATYDDRKGSVELAADLAKSVNRSPAPLSATAKIMVVEVEEGPSTTDLLLLPDNRLIVWRYFGPPPPWVHKGASGAACGAAICLFSEPR